MKSILFILVLVAGPARAAVSIQCSQNNYNTGSPLLRSGPDWVAISVTPSGRGYLGSLDYVGDKRKYESFQNIPGPDLDILTDGSGGSASLAGGYPQFALNLNQLIRVEANARCAKGYDCRVWIYSGSAQMQDRDGRSYSFDFPGDLRSYCSVKKNYGANRSVPAHAAIKSGWVCNAFNAYVGANILTVASHVQACKSTAEHEADRICARRAKAVADRCGLTDCEYHTSDGLILNGTLDGKSEMYQSVVQEDAAKCKPY